LNLLNLNGKSLINYILINFQILIMFIGSADKKVKLSSDDALRIMKKISIED
jgi:hypothetical protein